jgi:hypothetical protein
VAQGPSQEVPQKGLQPCAEGLHSYRLRILPEGSQIEGDPVWPGATMQPCCQCKPLPWIGKRGQPGSYPPPWAANALAWWGKGLCTQVKVGEGCKILGFTFCVDHVKPPTFQHFPTLKGELHMA